MSSNVLSLKKHGDYLVHTESTLVFKSTNEKIVIGRWNSLENKMIKLDDIAIKLCDEWKFNYENIEKDDFLDKSEMIDVIIKHYKKKINNGCNHNEYVMNRFKFDENLVVNLKINCYHNKDTYLVISILDYLRKSSMSPYDDEECDYDDKNLGFITGKKVSKIEDLVSFLFNDFRKDYAYSKILDKIELKTELKDKEKTKYSYYFLCENKKMDKCCVCYDYNLVVTNCGHNLCRICYNNIKEIIDEDNDYQPTKYCPMCRQMI